MDKFRCKSKYKRRKQIHGKIYIQKNILIENKKYKSILEKYIYKEKLYIDKLLYRINTKKE